jgi:hypothetical protein
VSCRSALHEWRYNHNEAIQDQLGKPMSKVMNMKMAEEDNHAEIMAGYEPATVDTLPSCENDSNVCFIMCFVGSADKCTMIHVAGSSAHR